MTGRAHRILVADDEEDVRLIVRFCLERTGRFEVLEAADGTEALERAFSDRPDLVLLDAMMPGVDGYAVCRALREDPRTEGIPIIFLTAKTQRDELAQGLEAGATDYLLKPFDPLTLGSILEHHLTGRDREDEG